MPATLSVRAKKLGPDACNTLGGGLVALAESVVALGECLVARADGLHRSRRVRASLAPMPATLSPRAKKLGPEASIALGARWIARADWFVALGECLVARPESVHALRVCSFALGARGNTLCPMLVRLARMP